jgi:hypothetical protein
MGIVISTNQSAALQHEDRVIYYKVMIDPNCCVPEKLSYIKNNNEVTEMELLACVAKKVENFKQLDSYKKED